MLESNVESGTNLLVDMETSVKFDLALVEASSGNNCYPSKFRALNLKFRKPHRWGLSNLKLGKREDEAA